jgi:hypothetical protein
MMRVSAKRAIAGQKGGIGSALARMKLENGARSRSIPPRAIAGQSSGRAAAGVDHSNSHQSLSSGGSGSAYQPNQQGPQPTGRGEQSAIAVSSELAAYVAKRTT